MNNDRFFATLQTGATTEATLRNLKKDIQDLVQQLNAAKIPISIGPQDTFPDGMLPGQTVIDWRTGTSVLKVWDGEALI